MTYRYKTKIYLHKNIFQQDLDKMTKEGWDVVGIDEQDDTGPHAGRGCAFFLVWALGLIWTRGTILLLALIRRKIRGEPILTIVQYRRNIEET